MKHIYCGNEGCRWHTEAKGGQFTLIGGKMICPDCLSSLRNGPAITDSCKSACEFTTTHFNGQPIEVKGLHHLRQLEKQFGVSNVAANYDKGNWGPPPPRESSVSTSRDRSISFGHGRPSEV